MVVSQSPYFLISFFKATRLQFAQVEAGEKKLTKRKHKYHNRLPIEQRGGRDTQRHHRSKGTRENVEGQGARGCKKRNRNGKEGE